MASFLSVNLKLKSSDLLLSFPNTKNEGTVINTLNTVLICVAVGMSEVNNWLTMLKLHQTKY